MNIEEKIKEILSLPSETEWVEFKVNNANPAEIGEYLSALSNSASYHEKDEAYLIFGIEDETYQIIGTTFQPKKEKIGNQELENWLATQLFPKIDFRIHELTINDKPIVAFVVDATRNIPVRFKGKPFIRIGSYKKNLDDHPERERKIWNKSNRYLFEKEIAMSLVDSDVVLSLIDYSGYFELTRQKLPENQTGILARLEQDKIIVKRNLSQYDITNLGALLFAKNLDQFEFLSRKSPRIIVYEGNNRIKAKREQVAKKGYAVGFEELVKNVNDWLPSYEEIGVALRQEVNSYSPLAVRELVANAIIHQDFLATGTSPMIEIFDTRIEITNPGKPLIPTLRFIDHSPESRNEMLAGFMRRLSICEERGSGIDKVILECELHQLPPPNFGEGDNYTRITLYAARTLGQMDKQDKIRASYQHCCLKVVSGELMSNQSLRHRFNIEEKNYPTVSKIIADTIEAGLIKIYREENKAKRYTKYVPWWF